MSADVPDATTFCRFRQELLGEELAEALFKIILVQLTARGDFKQGVSVDAMVVESSRRPKTTLEVIPEDKAEDTAPEQVTFSHSDDGDAAWVKKGKKTHNP